MKSVQEKRSTGSGTCCAEGNHHEQLQVHYILWRYFKGVPLHVHASCFVTSIIAALNDVFFWALICTCVLVVGSPKLSFGYIWTIWLHVLFFSGLNEDRDQTKMRAMVVQPGVPAEKSMVGRLQWKCWTLNDCVFFQRCHLSWNSETGGFPVSVLFSEG